MDKYFYGDGNNLGECRTAQAQTFKDLVDRYLSIPVLINRTKTEFLGLPKKQLDEEKKTNFLVPCTFSTSPSRRLTECASHCNLLFLDIDDATQAGHLLANQGTVERVLSPWAFALYTTARHTTSQPRLRVVVSASEIPLERYPDAVTTLAERLGVEANKESRVAVQPMFLPVCFLGQDVDSDHPLILDNREGSAFTVADIEITTKDGQTIKAKTPQLASLDDLEFLRPPVEEVTLDIAAEALDAIDPDTSYHTWLEAAAALKHQFSPKQDEAAFRLFDGWSSKGSKYTGEEDTREKWVSLKSTPKGRAPVTIRTLLKTATLNGWQSKEARDVCFKGTSDYIHSALSATELLQEGAKRIAATPLLGQAEEDALIHQLVQQAKKVHSLKVTPTSIRKDVNRYKQAAARTIKDEASKKLPAWVKGLVYVSSPDRIMRHQTKEEYSTESFDNTYSRKLLPTLEELRARGIENPSPAQLLTPTVSPSKYVLNEAKIPIAYATDYNPTQPNELFFVEDGRTYLNTYVRTYPAPKEDPTGEVARLFLNHVENLIAEPEYRQTLIDFLAFLVQHPGQKIRWAVLLQGAQGCGKTLLAEVMRAVLGSAHVKTVDSNALKGQWNEWACGYQLVTLEEIRVAGQNRHEIMNALKPLVSNTYIAISRKFSDTREAMNRTNYLLFTNHHDSLAITSDDRRYYVLKSKIQTKEQVQQLGGTEYFTRLFEMIRNHGAELRHFFETWKISDEFNPDGTAPSTSYKDDLVETSVNDTHQTVRQIILDGDNPLVQPDLISIQQLKLALDLAGGRESSMQYLGNLLREEGYAKEGRHSLDGNRHQLWTHLTRWDKRKSAAEVALSRLHNGLEKALPADEDIL